MAKEKITKKVKTMGKTIKKTADSLLTGQPVWVWSLSYAVAGAVVFLLAWVFFKILDKFWWLLLIILITAGAVYGTIAHSKQKK